MSNSKNNRGNMAAMDFYMQALEEKEYEKIRNNFETTVQPGPLLSMDIYAGNYHQALEKGRRKADLTKLLNLNNYITDLHEELIMKEKYDALVLTDRSQKIQWVNSGFSKMTGYSAQYALGKTPQFLQGPRTCEKIRLRIKEQLEKEEIFTENVINYRKNKEEYNCEITIIPLLNENKILTHYLAIEKEVA